MVVLDTNLSAEVLSHPESMHCRPEYIVNIVFEFLFFPLDRHTSSLNFGGTDVEQIERCTAVLCFHILRVEFDVDHVYCIPLNI